MSEYDSPIDAIDDVLEAVADPSLRRVRRDLDDRTARPTALDYLATIRSTDGALALDLEVLDPKRVIIRDGALAEALAGGYQIAVGTDGHLTTTDIPYRDAAELVRRYGTDVVLASEVAELFADADSAETPDVYLGP